MKWLHGIFRLVMPSLLLAACAGGTALPTPEPAEGNPPATETAPVDEAPPTAAPTASDYGDDDGYGSGGDASPTAPPVVLGNPTLEIGVTSLGEILVDADGLTLYILTSDSATQSTCGGGCASTWPPLTVTGELLAGAGLDATLVGTISRSDGSTQVTYAGHPLYRYAPDDVPGDVRGQGRSGVWFALSPAGEIIP